MIRKFFRKIISKIAARGFVRSALEDKADLSAFQEKPTPRILAGIFTIAFSYVLGWPAVACCAYLSLQFHNPWIVTLGGSAVYGLSHLVFLLGMYLAGATYSMIFLRWLTRVSVEKLLKWVD